MPFVRLGRLASLANYVYVCAYMYMYICVYMSVYNICMCILQFTCMYTVQMLLEVNSHIAELRPSVSAPKLDVLEIVPMQQLLGGNMYTHVYYIDA